MRLPNLPSIRARTSVKSGVERNGANDDEHRCPVKPGMTIRLAKDDDKGVAGGWCQAKRAFFCERD